MSVINVRTEHGDSGIAVICESVFIDERWRDVAKAAAADAQQAVTELWLPQAMALPVVVEYRQMLRRQGSMLSAAGALRLEAQQLDLDRQKLIHDGAGLAGEALALQLVKMQQQSRDLEERAKVAEVAAKEFTAALEAKRRSAEISLQISGQTFDHRQSSDAQLKRFAMQYRMQELGLQDLHLEYLRHSLYSCEDACKAAAARLLEQ